MRRRMVIAPLIPATGAHEREGYTLMETFLDGRLAVLVVLLNDSFDGGSLGLEGLGWKQTLAGLRLCFTVQELTRVSRIQSTSLARMNTSALTTTSGCSIPVPQPESCQLQQKEVHYIMCTQP